MAKKYILEPTELTFERIAKGGVWASLDSTPLYGLTYDEFKNLIPNGAILDINNGDKFIIVSDDHGTVATRDGTTPDTAPEEFAQFLLNVDARIDHFDVHSTVTTEAGTYTVAIYTETEATDPYPVKNFTYEHAEVAKNDIEDIIQAIYTRIGETESQTAHGHSPADRLVIAVAELRNVNPTKALTTGNYPNQMKRIAAIIRGDFGRVM